MRTTGINTYYIIYMQSYMIQIIQTVLYLSATHELSKSKYCEIILSVGVLNKKYQSFKQCSTYVNNAPCNRE